MDKCHCGARETAEREYAEIHRLMDEQGVTFEDAAFTVTGVDMSTDPATQLRRKRRHGLRLVK